MTCNIPVESAGMPTSCSLNLSVDVRFTILNFASYWCLAMFSIGCCEGRHLL